MVTIAYDLSNQYLLATQYIQLEKIYGVLNINIIPFLENTDDIYYNTSTNYNNINFEDEFMINDNLYDNYEELFIINKKLDRMKILIQA